MIKTNLLTIVVALSMAGCAGNSGGTGNANSASPSNNAGSNAPANASAAKESNAAPKANTANSSNSGGEKPASSGPKRISFTKGSTNAIEYFELEPGESRQFVVGAVKGQDLTVGSGGDLKITMITKGKTVDEKSDAVGYNGTTIAGGDFVFEVTNTSKKKNKSSVNVIIENIGDE